MLSHFLAGIHLKLPDFEEEDLGGLLGLSLGLHLPLTFVDYILQLLSFVVVVLHLHFRLRHKLQMIVRNNLPELGLPGDNVST